MSDPLFTRFANRLLQATATCRPDMHEPDEQGIDYCKITGTHLDNAMGDDPLHNCGEQTVEINGEWFNLATLIAFARLGARRDGPVLREGADV